MKEIWDQWDGEINLFTFGKVDLVPTVEEYTTLFHCPKIQIDEAYSRAKGDSKCIPWKSLRDLILVHPDVNKIVDVFALGIYGSVIFPKALGHIDEAVSDLFDRLDKRNYTPLKELVATPRRDDILEGKWMAILQNLQDVDVEWRAPWMIPEEILYRCEDFD
ncbi:hypothetical protein Goari_020476 [Gossypium aridum]|uniref:Uncharacterized protein n=1 Tax=Gossypium aridum TaxID=34290 RepID=A0A7J8YQL1_GOSAI|nr:hypothetical protein [Gossypium aridum]